MYQDFPNGKVNLYVENMGFGPAKNIILNLEYAHNSRDIRAEVIYPKKKSCFILFGSREELTAKTNFVNAKIFYEDMIGNKYEKISKFEIEDVRMEYRGPSDGVETQLRDIAYQLKEIGDRLKD